MEEYTVKVGTIQGIGSGQVNDSRRPVTFVGEQLATRTEYDIDYKSGSPTDTRGVTETLYRTQDDRMVVYVEDWSRWRGEPSTYSLVEVTEDDLDVGGRFEHLAREAGLGRALTLDEVLEPQGFEVLESGE